MSTGITFSGFNSIDFNVVLNAIMTQESQPLTALQTRQSSLQSRINNFSTLNTRVTALQSAATALSTTSGASSFKATSSDATALGVSAGSSAVAGRYEVKVLELAKAQVTASDTTAPDADTTAVATGGSLTIGGKTVTLSGSVTLKGLSDAINANADVPVRASVVQASATTYKLVLTGKSTGEANAFTITNGLTGSTLTFAGNAVEATDADLLVNNVSVKNSSNTLDTVIPGTTMTLYKKDPANAVIVDVAADASALKTKLQTFVTAYNDLVRFTNDQNTSAGKNDPASIGRDPQLRALRNELRSKFGTEFVTGSTFKYLSQIGIEIARTGTMQIKDSVFADATKNGLDEVAKLLAGNGTNGALATIGTTLKEYTKTAGFLQTAQTQLTAQITRLGTQISSMQDRLAVRRASLQQEFTAADAAMSRLKNQSASLSNVSL